MEDSMAQISDLVEEGKHHRLFIVNKQGKRLVELPVIWAVVIGLVVHQLAVLVVIGALLGIVSVGLEEIGTKPDLEGRTGEE
jgi:hypothetical protein